MGEFNSDDHQVYYCGQESLRRNGVAFIVNKRVGKAVLGYNLQNDRMISVQIQGKPFNITVVQVYAPTTGAEEAEVDRFYEGLQHLLELTPKNDVLIIMGDWNAKVGSQKITGITGKFGLGVQNEAGHRLVEFCQENTMVIANTLFQQPKRRLYTWTSPDGQHRNQIDYVLCSQRWRSSISGVSNSTYLGAAGSRVWVRLGRIKHSTTAVVVGCSSRVAPGGRPGRRRRFEGRWAPPPSVLAIGPRAAIMLKILQARLQQYVDRELPDVQAGFRRRRGTRDQIVNIRWIMEKAREFQKNIYFCFIDYAKAFDCVDHNQL
ncbi:Craniofacial development protein 2 [Varanus komodoensis]|nr:Craniofacial development protein 2 [Varanus komodoensis]